MKKLLTISLALVMGMTVLAGCTSKTNSGSTSEGGEKNTFNASKEITVVSREDGTGTRGTFVELTGVEQKNAEGKKEDKTTIEAVIASKTDIMMTNIENDTYAIGYISMGSLKSSVKAVSIDGNAPTSENVKNGSYTLARPFNIATTANVSEVAQDFINFIMSAQGQEIVAKSYIAVDENLDQYTSSNLSGKIIIAGSSSVSPLMEKLKEAYVALNPSVTIELQTSDSTAGMTAAVEGICDIGMASRELKDSEKEKLNPLAIALDGIAVIVNNENPTDSLTKDQIKNIYTGEVTTWDNI